MSVAVQNASHIPFGFPAQVPPRLDATDHVQRCLAQLRSKSQGLEKYIFLNGLKERDPELFYKILITNMMEIIPILYTPTVGDACTNYSHIWRRPEGLYVSIEHKGRIREVLRSWPATSTPRIAVVTDGSRILGLGDLGANGLPISIGKLDLYIAGAGIKPSTTIPVCLDVGTNTQRYLEDPLYIGVRQTRPKAAEMDAFMEEFMSAMAEVFPELIVQFEDFSTDNAFKYLDMFRNRYSCFNDDIQGTGAVVLSGFINAAKLASAASGLPLTEHKILFLGAGSSGIGVAKQLLSFFTSMGMTVEEAKNKIYTVDSKGLVTADREGLQEHKKFFARTDYQGPPLKKLADIVEYVKPTALLGLSTLRNAFTEDVVKLMASINKRPIIFPLSNPVSLSEVDFEDAVKWTNGSVIFASGSPYKPVEYGGKLYEAGQGNNMYQFPGIGLGAILSKAKHVSDAMVDKAAIALAESLNDEEKTNELVYPRLHRIREISGQVSLAVIRQAQAEGLDRNTEYRNLCDAELLKHIKDKMWEPSDTFRRGRL
ncbi:malate dehydrogenase [Dendrothele bispora CBS 962.96]|uniref:Malic enzyme n=1 Tax=Dendrothele bispora (strain CBS 962.96) TaxID=1314807 RepID=A0A4S8MQB0_DENBC|nr:malate dehydrogenase [Dendrothele bispora CBS 962.96]